MIAEVAGAGLGPARSERAGSSAAPRVSVVDDAWHRVAFTRASGGAMALYVDGTSVNSWTHTADIEAGNGAHYGFMIGARQGHNTGPHPWIGPSDEVCAWNRALSASEMADDMAALGGGGGDPVGGVFRVGEKY